MLRLFNLIHTYGWVIQNVHFGYVVIKCNPWISLSLSLLVLVMYVSIAYVIEAWELRLILKGCLRFDYHFYINKYLFIWEWTITLILESYCEEFTSTWIILKIRNSINSINKGFFNWNSILVSFSNMREKMEKKMRAS